MSSGRHPFYGDIVKNPLRIPTKVFGKSPCIHRVRCVRCILYMECYRVNRLIWFVKRERSFDRFCILLFCFFIAHTLLIEKYCASAVISCGTRFHALGPSVIHEVHTNVRGGYSRFADEKKIIRSDHRDNATLCNCYLRWFLGTCTCVFVDCRANIERGFFFFFIYLYTSKRVLFAFNLRSRFFFRRFRGNERSHRRKCNRLTRRL